jgi:hypothetical protein
VAYAATAGLCHLTLLNFFRNPMNLQGISLNVGGFEKKNMATA